MSADEPLVHFGLGGAERIERLTISWPSGVVQTLEDLPADQMYVIEEPARVAGTRDPRAAIGPTFREAAGELGLVLDSVREAPFDDYARQPLLPARLSQLGPGMAWGDVDADGDQDLFVGGSAGRSGTLFANAGTGSFEVAPGPWARDAASEDMSPLFVDVDGDGDLDLFVASGGIECDPGDALLRDRLYWNDGKGRFERAAPGTLADVRESSGTVVAGDFDGDLDLDLFVGARSVPGAYPTAPRSVLLLNEGGVLRDRTDELAPGLAGSGMVTSAIAADFDGDARTDLAVAYDWGPIRLWSSCEAGLCETTASAGLGERTGWWSALTAADLDADGDLDLVALNAGLNTKYSASPAKPALLYYGDLDGSGAPHLVEAKSSAAQTLPVRGLSCSADAMPMIQRRITSFDQFARAALPDIYPSEVLEAALELRATELASGVLINRSELGSGASFEWRELPRLAQAAPGCGVVASDFDGDGNQDLFVVQNAYQREPETGRWDGGVGVLLAGTGAAAFSVVPAWQSGLVVPGDGTSLTICDLDADGRPDLVAAQNEGPLLAFLDVHGPRRIAVAFQGAAPNTACIGARITIASGVAAGTVFELGAGGGYLSQSAPELFVSLPADEDEVRIEVRWPDGEHSSHRLSGDTARVVLRQP